MTDRTLDPEILNQWIGKSTRRTDFIHLQPALFMEATLDREASLNDGGRLPLGWHWLYFLEAKPTSQLGRDGHPALGGFLPPVALPRRMWAGCRLKFHQPVIIGDTVRKVSTIKEIKLTSGRSGQLCFVTVCSEFWRNQDLLISEDHDIVYRSDPDPETPSIQPPRAEPDADISRTITPSPVMLYRYSALTFNGHRIHYDIDYCRDVEGYPGLVFHAPLTATLLLDLLSSATDPESITRFDFRAISPLFADREFTINLNPGNSGYSLWATNPDGYLAIDGTAN
jgi:3-methylfumaryl-CoA hydratase